MPPRVAPTQVVVIPILNSKMSDADKQGMLQQAEDIVSSLKKAGVRVQSDSRENYTPGWKYNHWELKVSCYCRICRCFSGVCAACHRTLPHIPAEGKTTLKISARLPPLWWRPSTSGISLEEFCGAEAICRDAQPRFSC